MSHLNVEIKARCADLDAARAVLERLGARCHGTDAQTDTYYPCATGRFKLREGTIERTLVHYSRPDVDGPRRCDVTLERLPAGVSLGPVLAAALGVDTVVVKQREIWFLDHVKLHLDRLEGLGTFLEIEAIDLDGSRGEAALRAQCEALMAELGVLPGDLVYGSYRELV